MALTLSLPDTAKHALTAEELKQFKEQGYIGPFPLFKKGEVESRFNSCKWYPDVLLPWRKSRHAAVRAMAEIGMHPVILAKVVSILGQDVLLWGSQLIEQKPFKKHRIHIDIEHTNW